MSDSEIPVKEPLALSLSVNKENEDQLTDSIESQHEEHQRSNRERTLTEKGQAYQECRREEKEKEEDRLLKKFNGVYETWKKEVTLIETFLASEASTSKGEKNEKISNLQTHCEDVHKVYEKLRQVRLPRQEILRMVDTCDTETRNLQQQIARQSFRKEQSRNGEDKSSVCSKASARSKGSRSSRTSFIDLKKADAAAELAAKQAEFDALQEEAKYKEETANMEAQLRAETARIENELARRKLELEPMEVKKQIEIARAKLMVYEEVE